ncbi:MAG: BON domain-containing protein [Chloroflexi bacterium]|nr:MAG: BON domain-containing protein [Chloroflexota bacterium]
MGARSMKHCPLCDKDYGDELSTCPRQVVKGRYRILRKLGEGGMGSVFLAEQLSISRKVALKVLHREFARDREFVQRFHQEAKLAATLNNPSITTVFDFDQGDDGSLFIVMEYLEGTLLSDLIRRDGPMDVGRAVRLGIQVAEALGAAHAMGVIHRDVKPQNIMVLTPGDRVKLMDFGIARIGDTGDAHLTRAGALMGTPNYMAPEQIEGRPVSVKTDIYAFGVVLYEMLTGATPFNAPTSTAVLTKQLREPPAPLRRARPEVSPLVEQVVMQALEKEPEWRQETVGGLSAAPPPSRIPVPAPAVAPSPSVAPPPKVGAPTMASAATMVSAPASDATMVSARTIVSAHVKTPSSPPEHQAPLAPSGEKSTAWARLREHGWKVAVVAGGMLLIAVTVAIALYVSGRPSSPVVVATPTVSQPPSVDLTPTATVPPLVTSPPQIHREPPRPVTPPSGAPKPSVSPKLPVKEPGKGGEPSSIPPARPDSVTIRSAVEKNLAAAGFLRRDDSDDVGVRVENVGADGVVKLSGVLRTKADREAAIRLAQSVPGVTAVLPRVNLPWNSQ